MVPETDRARLQAILIEHKHWTQKEEDLWIDLVEYLKFVRGELTTRAVIPPVHWKLLWTELSDYALYNLCQHSQSFSEKEMGLLMDLCCEYAYKQVTNLSPMELLCRIFTCSDPKFVMTRMNQPRFLRGFKNAKHALLEETIHFDY